MASTTENTTANTENITPTKDTTKDNQHPDHYWITWVRNLGSEKATCECHKINWNFTTFIHTLKSTGEKLDSENGICCQSKVNDGYWTHEQYEERCVVMDEHEEQILASYERDE